MPPIPNVIAAFAGQGWALHPRFLDTALAVLERRDSMGFSDAAAVRAALGDKAARPSADRAPSRIDAGPVGEAMRAAGVDVTVVRNPDEKRDPYDGTYLESGDVGDELYTLFAKPGVRNSPAVAVVPVYGVLAARASMINGLSQPTGMSYARAARGLQAAAADPRVAGGRGMILLDIDSPGGTVSGVDKMLSAVSQIRAAGTPVHAYAGDLAASAAYWIASRCETVLGPAQAAVGSIGVYVLMDDTSGVDRKGVKKVLVASGPAKATGADGIPITAEQLAYVQREILTIASTFAHDVVTGRRLTPEQAAEVLSAAVYVGADAVGLGLLDGLRSFTEVVAAMVDAL